MNEIKELLISAGFWPWLVLLVIVVLVAGLTITEINFPGGGGLKFTSPSLTKVGEDWYDLSLTRTSSNIRWSHYMNKETKAIVPSSNIFIDKGQVNFMPFTKLPEWSDRQIAAAQNAIEETAEIGKEGVPRRYEITPQFDGGLPTTYLLLTKLKYSHRSSQNQEATIEIRYLLPDNRLVHVDRVHLKKDIARQMWSQN